VEARGRREASFRVEGGGVGYLCAHVTGAGLYICMRILVISMGVVMTIWQAPAMPPAKPSRGMLPLG